MNGQNEREQIELDVESALEPTAATSLRDARAWIEEHREEGAACPCCGLFVKVYRRRISAASATLLAKCYREAGLRDFYLPAIAGGHPGDFAKLRYWGLIAPAGPDRRADGSSSTGRWRITLEGELWLHGRRAVPRFARIFDGELLGLEGPLDSIEAVADVAFDFGEIMEPAS